VVAGQRVVRCSGNALELSASKLGQAVFVCSVQTNSETVS
jgi:hypothetical protein